jgi:hypothetical protein
MSIIKSYEQFVNEAHLNKADRTYQSIIYDMYLGDALTIYLPEDFVLEYERGFGEFLKKDKFECNMIKLWYWDEDDHQGLDYYFHTPGENQWVCKLGDLTPESYKKLKDYLKSHTYSENEKYKNDPRNATK